MPRPPARSRPQHPLPPSTPAPLPADKSVSQTITVNGKALHYTATVGTITLHARDGKSTGEVVYTRLHP